ncbi:hypothetical protein FNYG_01345 [Fusarium nygamai]|uniref:Uncharacterized protein n=1 Tax=Gibberella nygamai TaxID=42673 RepID=A0A2K0WSV9_GIBNY|nr:hypothetical protein FNYG_01345 [Fusarium nygamai]
MPHSRQSSSPGVESLLSLAQRGLKYLSAHVDKTETIIINGTVFPLDAFSLNDRNDLAYLPPGETQRQVSLLSLAAYKGLDEVIHALAGILNHSDHRQDHLDDALFWAHFANHEETADLLLDFGANPGQESRSNGLHGAVRRQHMSQVRLYIQEFGVPVDVEDGHGATPVMYAMQLEHPHDVETISSLFDLGADPRHEFGDEGWSYAQYASAIWEKEYLVKWLEVKRREAEAKAKRTTRTTPTSIRKSSCTIGRD